MHLTLIRVLKTAPMVIILWRDYVQRGAAYFLGSLYSGNATRQMVLDPCPYILLFRSRV